MKFSCEKVLLQNAIAVTSRAVAQKSSIPALEGLLLHADHQLTISGYNMQTGIRTKVSAGVAEEGDVVLHARLFGDIIRRMPDDIVTFSVDEKKIVHLSCGDAKFDISGISADDYPDLPEVEDENSNFNQPLNGGQDKRGGGKPAADPFDNRGGQEHEQADAQEHRQHRHQQVEHPDRLVAEVLVDPQVKFGGLFLLRHA